ncbi:Mut7-C ubiquitin/RNAse domain-containing protein [Dyella acidisoli]|uniref:Twitching motility protein PilT n=2 Tax=Dyella acidisoli TaxID=1867834 RepID=A0ABQ5XM95_9GAMM|nr:hypothetical protein GCM10007901_17670 [Dyella acidisoli]
MVTATFRFYEELNDFLAPALRRREFERRCARAATTKHMIEALGVPHTEVELVLVNGESTGFNYLLCDGDRVAVYPKFEALDITPLLHVRAQPLRVTRFVADAHMGGLAHLLRMCGFDTLYDNHFEDDRILELSLQEERIILTRDRELLKRREVTHGCYVHALKSPQQLREVIARLDLSASARPFTLCLDCNAPLHDIDKAFLHQRVPASVLERQNHFVTCNQCHRVYWEGSHWQHMREYLRAIAGVEEPCRLG